MQIPWALLIALTVLAFAYLIKHFFSEVIEEDHTFLMIIGIFLVSYIAAAIAVGSLNPVNFLPAGSSTLTALR